MTVRVGRVSFHDWISLPFADGWSDTFIFRVDARACLPPFAYKPLLQRMAAAILPKRSSASLWIQVDSPGAWYLAEVKRAMLPGLRIPYVVTRMGEEPDYCSFSFRPKLSYSPSARPPMLNDETQALSLEEMRCLQTLARITLGNELDIASLAGLEEDVTKKILAGLEMKKLIVHTVSSKIRGRKSMPLQMDLFPQWSATSKGLSLALRSWGVPKGIEFTARSEENLHHIETGHRHISRRWLSWLRAAYPHAEIWTGWSEVRLPGTSVIPDALAWGCIRGYETLFWLEVGDEHKSRRQIIEITKKRLDEAWKFCQRTGVRLVYTQLSVDWVHEAARWEFNQLPAEVAVVTGNPRRFGKLPMVEWGKANFNNLNL